MRLARLDVTSAELEALPVLITDQERPIVIRVSDADSVTILAGVCAGWEGSWGVWLVASEEYPAALIARDVKTLSTLTQLEHVVIGAASHARAHADVVRALLSAEEVNLANAVATITAAYNRPAPPRDIQVWSASSAGRTLERDGHILQERESRGGITIFTSE